MARNAKERIYYTVPTPEAQKISEAPEWEGAILRTAESYRTIAERALLSLTHGSDPKNDERLARARTEIQSRIQRALDERSAPVPPAVERLKKELLLKPKFLSVQHMIENNRWTEGIALFESLLHQPHVVPDRESHTILVDWMHYVCAYFFHRFVTHKEGRKVLVMLELLGQTEWFEGSRITSDIEKIIGDDEIIDGIRQEVLFSVLNPDRFKAIAKALDRFGLDLLRKKLQPDIEEKAFECLISETFDSVWWDKGRENYLKRLSEVERAGMFRVLPHHDEVIIRYVLEPLKSGNVEQFIRRRDAVVQNESKLFASVKSISHHPWVRQTACSYLIAKYARPELASERTVFNAYGIVASTFADAGIMERKEFDDLPEIRQYLELAKHRE